MLRIDFHGGTHGNFLEYVVNVHIFKTTASSTSIYTAGRGSAHEADDMYKQSRIAVCGHFSDNAQGRLAEPKYRDFKFDQDDAVVRIDIDQTDDQSFFIAFTNLIHRTSGATFDEHMSRIPADIRADRQLLRTDFFSKINERALYANLFPKFSFIWNKKYNFPFTSFYSYPEFCVALKQLANWLEQEFVPTENLYNLWVEFIEKNQGWHSYTKCSTIIENSLANIDSKIDCTELEEAWINFNLMKVTGNLVCNDKTYPTNTQQIYQLIQL